MPEAKGARTINNAHSTFHTGDASIQTRQVQQGVGRARSAKSTSTRVAVVLQRFALIDAHAISLDVARGIQFVKRGSTVKEWLLVAGKLFTEEDVVEVVDQARRLYRARATQRLLGERMTPS
jgi:hypothetical protein